MAAAPPQNLEELVRDELRGPVSELVRQVVVEIIREQLNGTTRAAETGPESHHLPRVSTNGRAAIPEPPPASTKQTAKQCTLCGETKPASAFARHRRQCRACRNKRYEKKQEQPASTEAVDEEPARTG